MRLIYSLSIVVTLLIPLYGKEKTVDEKKAELLDFKSIKKILKNDQLEKIVKEKKKALSKVVKKRVEKIEKSYAIPSEHEIWNFLTEYWLVLNVQKLKWDFKKPDYGVHKHFESFLEKMSFQQKNDVLPYKANSNNTV